MYIFIADRVEFFSENFANQKGILKVTNMVRKISFILPHSPRFSRRHLTVKVMFVCFLFFF